MLKTLRLKNFTVFEDIEIDLSPGVNIVIGENSTGKTHLMKAAYSVCRPDFGSDKESSSEAISKKLVAVFKPDKDKLGRLARRGADEDSVLELHLHGYTDNAELHACFNSRSQKLKLEDNSSFSGLREGPVFIPTKEVLSFVNGFVSLYDSHRISFDETYRDVCADLAIPEVREEALATKSKWALDEIKEICGGQFHYNGGIVTFKQSRNEEFAASLIAEGHRKLGVLYRLLENQSINPGKSGPLFWDEPEANLNPKLLSVVVKILLELTRLGQQVVIATHNYVLLKALDLERLDSDAVMYHTLFREQDQAQVKTRSTSRLDELEPNAIDDAYAALISREVDDAMGGLGK